MITPRWTGLGTPREDWTERLVNCLKAGAQLPPAEWLQESTDAEASAARALDLMDSDRISVAFQADDPIFLASSVGEAQRTLKIISEWAFKWKAQFHITENKNVAMMHLGEDRTLENIPRLQMPNVGRDGDIAISWAKQHKWLGLTWRMEGGWLPTAKARLAAAETHLSMLSGLVQSCSVPISLAVVLFDSKIDGSVAYGRWLWGVYPECAEALDRSYENWARFLLGSCPWRNPGVAVGELGWKLSGAARAVRDAAGKRAYFWNLPDTDVFKICFVRSHGSAGMTWAAMSSLALAKWGVPDWPKWRRSEKGGTAAYKKAVKRILAEQCLQIWKKTVSGHLHPLNYLNQREAPSEDYAKGLQSELPFEVLVGQRAVSRLRCGLIDFGHIDGHRSQARTQQCIFCGKRVLASSLLVHAWSRCSNTTEGLSQEERSRITDMSHSDVAKQVACSPGDEEYVLMVKRATLLDNKACAFWMLQE